MNQHDIQEQIAAHVLLYRQDPEAGRRFDTRPLGGPGIVDTLLLTTTGRTSGQARVTPLIFHEEPAGYVVVASNGGRPSLPFWYLNLVADSRCRIQVGDLHLQGTSKVLAGAERTAAWAHMVAIYPPYSTYQKAVAHLLPVVRLEPVGGG